MSKMSKKTFAIFRKDGFFCNFTDCENNHYCKLVDEDEFDLHEVSLSHCVDRKKSSASINGDGSVQLHEVFFNKEELLADITSKLKNECNKRIRTFNGKTYSNIRWLEKSQNFQDIKHRYAVQKLGEEQKNLVSESDYRFAKQTLDRKDRYVDRYSELKVKIKSMSLDELNEFMVSDDKHWEGLD